MKALDTTYDNYRGGYDLSKLIEDTPPLKALESLDELRHLRLIKSEKAKGYLSLWYAAIAPDLFPHVNKSLARLLSINGSKVNYMSHDDLIHSKKESRLTIKIRSNLAIYFLAYRDDTFRNRAKIRVMSFLRYFPLG